MRIERGFRVPKATHRQPCPATLLTAIPGLSPVRRVVLWGLWVRVVRRFKPQLKARRMRSNAATKEGILQQHLDNNRPLLSTHPHNHRTQPAHKQALASQPK